MGEEQYGRGCQKMRAGKLSKLTQEQVKNLYDMQRNLNKKIFDKAQIIGNIEHDQNWLIKFANEALYESIELSNAIFEGDYQNEIVELVDVLHFILSMGLTLGVGDFIYPEFPQEDRIYRKDYDTIDNSLHNLQNSIAAISDCMPRKWWGKKTPDWNAATLEYHTLIYNFSYLVFDLGLTLEQVYDIYCQKNKINHKRQDEGYDLDHKTEDDNKTIEVEEIEYKD